MTRCPDTVNEALLVEMEGWRRQLAGNLALRNDGLDDRSLDLAVRRILDGILFLRICEDRGIERAGRLRELLTGEPAYPRLLRLFHDAGGRYNSGLFWFKTENGRDMPRDEVTRRLAIDDAALQSIIERLYEPHGVFDFSVVSADILGLVYERFLGNVIARTDGCRVKVEDKPGVRKAGGVYYTPTEIIDYIVRHSVAPLLEARATPTQAASLKVLDPACGCGSFLLGAYQYLLDWHLKWYLADGPEKGPTGKRAALRQGSDSRWRLTIDERERILLEHIHGVDIDPQAVEVTKLSLLLKLFDGVTTESPGGPQSIPPGRALPDLGHNIKCGNSLIGTEFLASEPGKAMSPDERCRVRAFDWHSEFPQVFQAGGFDAVIGNPPYLNGVEQRTRFDQAVNEHLRATFPSAKGAIDASVLFQDLALRVLRPHGRASMIVPNKFLSAPFGAAYRALVTRSAEIRLLADFSTADVFHGVGAYPVVYALEKATPPRDNYPIDLEVHSSSDGNPVLVRRASVDASPSKARTWSQLFSGDRGLLDELENCPRLGDLYEVAASATAAEAYTLKECLTDKQPASAHFTFVTSGAIDRYTHSHGDGPMRYLKTDYRHPYLPAGCQHLSGNRRRQYSSEKLLFAGLTRRLEATWAAGMLAGSVPTVQVLAGQAAPYSLKFVLGVVNSSLVDWVFRQYFSSLSLAGGYLRIGVPQIRALPLPRLTMASASDKLIHDELVALVDAMLSLHEQRKRTNDRSRRQSFDRRIGAADREIDALVYRLFGITGVVIG